MSVAGASSSVGSLPPTPGTSQRGVTIQETPKEEVDLGSIPLGQGKRSASAASSSAYMDMFMSRQDQAFEEKVKQRASKKTDPFLTPITYRCMELNPVSEEISFHPWTGQVALMMVDISGYSKIAAAAKTAFELAEAVSTCFAPILAIIRRLGGEVVKYAGDAILVLWAVEGNRDENAVCRIASLCAIELQERCGTTVVESMNQTLKLHIGISFGVLRTEVYNPQLGPTNSLMPKYFYFMSGGPLREIEPVVNAAVAEEVWASAAVRARCGDVILCDDSHMTQFGACRIERKDKTKICPPNVECDLLESEDDEEGSSNDLDDLLLMPYFVPGVSEGFVAPTIVQKLKVGFRQADLSEMRYLYVLFIKKAESTNDVIDVVDWFEEVHAIMAQNHCAITQIIDDDKGVHVVAALNLYIGGEDSADTAVHIAHLLQKQHVECQVGIAAGQCFCGIIGDEDSCKWDITGYACVRACRLMEYAEKQSHRGLHVAIDETVVKDMADRGIVAMHSENVTTLKGSHKPVPVYTLATSDSARAIGSMCAINSFAEGVYQEERELLRYRLQERVEGLCRTAAVVVGPPESGKKFLALSALGKGDTEFIPLRHRTSRTPERLDICRTVAEWFQYYRGDSDEIVPLAKEVVSELNQKHWTGTSRAFLKLIKAIVISGLRIAVIVDRAQYMDNATLRLIAAASKQCSVSLAQAKLHKYIRPLGVWQWIFCLTPTFGCQTAYTIQQRAISLAEPPRETPPSTPPAEFGSSHEFGDGSSVMSKRSWKASTSPAPLASSEEGDVPIIITVGNASVDDIRGYIRWFQENVPAGPNLPSVVREKCDGNPGLAQRLIQMQVSHLLPNMAAFREGKIKPEELYRVVEVSGAPYLTDAGYELWRKLEYPPGFVMRLWQFFDVLHPKHQLLLKVLSCIDRDCVQPPPASVICRVTAKFLPHQHNVSLDDVCEALWEALLMLQELLLVTVEGNYEKGTVRVGLKAFGTLLANLVTPVQLLTCARVAATLMQESKLVDRFGPKPDENASSEVQEKYLLSTVRHHIHIAILWWRAENVDGCRRHLSEAWERVVALHSEPAHPEDLPEDLYNAPEQIIAMAAQRCGVDLDSLTATVSDSKKDPAGGGKAPSSPNSKKYAAATERKPTRFANRAPPTPIKFIPAEVQGTRFVEPPLVLGPVSGMVYQIGQNLQLRYQHVVGGRMIEITPFNTEKYVELLRRCNLSITAPNAQRSQGAHTRRMSRHALLKEEKEKEEGMAKFPNVKVPVVEDDGTPTEEMLQFALYPGLSVELEEDFVRYLVLLPYKDAEEAKSRCGLFLEYVKNVVVPRSAWIENYIGTLAGVKVVDNCLAGEESSGGASFNPAGRLSGSSISPSPRRGDSSDDMKSCGPLAHPRNRPARDCDLLFHSLEILLPITAENKNSPESRELVREALLILAVGGWKEVYPYMSPGKIREAWLNGWISPLEIKAIIFLFLLDCVEDTQSVTITTRATYSFSLI